VLESSHWACQVEKTSHPHHWVHLAPVKCFPISIAISWSQETDIKTKSEVATNKIGTKKKESN